MSLHKEKTEGLTPEEEVEQQNFVKNHWGLSSFRSSYIEGIKWWMKMM